MPADRWDLLLSNKAQQNLRPIIFTYHTGVVYDILLAH